jgi:hypothetical protein
VDSIEKKNLVLAGNRTPSIQQLVAMPSYRESLADIDQPNVYIHQQKQTVKNIAASSVIQNCATTARKIRRTFSRILYFADLLLSNNSEISNYTTAVTR